MMLDLRPVLDFAGSSNSALDARGRVDAARWLLSEQIIEYAAQCRDQRELLDGLMRALDPAYGFECIRMIGQGSTRRTWSLPFNLVLKLVRWDRLTDQEMAYRGSHEYLKMRRIGATFNEFMTALEHPALLPRIFGVLLAFGEPPLDHPGLIISERADISGRKAVESVSVNDLFICGEAGYLLINDPRLNPEAPTTDPPDRRPYWDKFRGGDESIHFSNFGRVDGRWVLLDMGNVYDENRMRLLKKYIPPELIKNNSVTPENALRISRLMYEFYEGRRYLLMGGTRPDTGGYGDE
jgi:hypothetical protein